jgi:hypothetical protein
LACAISLLAALSSSNAVASMRAASDSDPTRSRLDIPWHWVAADLGHQSSTIRQLLRSSERRLVFFAAPEHSVGRSGRIRESRHRVARPEHVSIRRMLRRESGPRGSDPPA